SRGACGPREVDGVSLITVNGLSKTFHTGSVARPVLRSVSFEVARGEFVCIVGAMGSGKSTLLAIMAGLLKPDAGTVTIDGAAVNDLPKGTAFVFQNYSLLPW